MKILLNSLKNINSVNVDNYNKIELSNRNSLISEYEIRNVLSATEVFDLEREAFEIYRIYGKIEYLSLLNGLKSQYKEFKDFFTPQKTGNFKDIVNSFKFYLVKPASTGYTYTIKTYYYVDENFTNWVTSTPSDYPVGWSINVGTGSYMEQTPTNQAKFVFGTESSNLITLSKNITTPMYGEISIESIINIQPNLVTGSDSFTITLFNGTNTVYSVNMLVDGTGYKKYTVNIPSNTPITKVSILASSNNKSMFVDYLKIYSKSQSNIGQNRYIRYFEVIATESDFDIYPVGFANNVYGEQGFTFNFNKDFDVSEYTDDFGFPLTELFLYAQYKPTSNGFGTPETLSGTIWTTTKTVSGLESKFSFTPKELVIGDYVESFFDVKIGDVVEYSKSQFFQTQKTPQTHYIETPYKEGSLNKRLIWKYNPFIPFRLRYFGDDLYRVNTGNTSYELVSSIPNYATKVDTFGNYAWRKILPQGYIDPLTGIGVDYPFVNRRRYLFSTIVFDITPDLTDDETYDAFKNVWYTNDAIPKTTTPTGDINNIGKPC